MLFTLLPWARTAGSCIFLYLFRHCRRSSILRSCEERKPSPLLQFQTVTVSAVNCLYYLNIPQALVKVAISVFFLCASKTETAPLILHIQRAIKIDVIAFKNNNNNKAKGQWDGSVWEDPTRGPMACVWSQWIKFQSADPQHPRKARYGYCYPSNSGVWKKDRTRFPEPAGQPV